MADSNASPTAFFHFVMNPVSRMGSCFVRDATFSSRGARSEKKGTHPVMSKNTQPNLCNHSLDVHLPRPLVYLAEPPHDLTRHLARNVMSLHERRDQVLDGRRVVREAQRNEVVEQELQDRIKMHGRDRAKVACECGRVRTNTTGERRLDGPSRTRIRRSRRPTRNSASLA